MHRLVFAVLMLIVTAGVVHAAPAGTPQEFLLDVLVTAPGGGVIVGLDKEDFVVRMDGQPVEIMDLTFYGNRRLLAKLRNLPGKGIDLDKLPQERYFILLFERQGNFSETGTSLTKRRQEMGKFARKWTGFLEPNDWVAVASYETRLDLHQDFTRDPEALSKAIDAAVLGRSVATAHAPAEARPSLAANLPRGKELVRRTTSLHDALEVLGQAAAGITGRKNLLLVSDGFERGSSGPFGRSPGQFAEIDRAVRSLNAGNVAVYTTDLTQRVPALQGLERLAETTGGRHVQSYGALFYEVGRDNVGYYLLRYRAPNPAAASGFQKVEVGVVGPDATVRTRSGPLGGDRR
jgi:VWFA-related protein